MPAVPFARKPAPASRRCGLFLFASLSLAAALALAAPAPRAAQPADAVVVDVVDGDTIRVRTGGATATVRLIGIDTPERGHPARPKEFAADEAASALAALCGGKAVRLERDVEEADKYGRLLRYVFTGDGEVLVNRELVRNGAARVYRRFPFSRRAEFEAAEAAARAEGRGLWRDGGLEELRWVRAAGREPVRVWPLWGGEYGVTLGGAAKAGLDAKALAPAVAELVRLRDGLSDGDFAAAAARAGYGPLDAAVPSAAPAAAPARPPGDAVRAREAGAAPAAPKGDGVVPWDRAHERMGETVTVEGTVVRARRSGRTVFLNFHDNWKRYVTVVLFTGGMPGLPPKPEAFYAGKRIRVRGTVQRYKDRPEIVPASAADLRVVP